MMIDALGGRVLCGFVKALTGARVRWIGCPPAATQRVYYANHTSHGDFALLWACLPPDLRSRTRPVAGADYWGEPGIKSYIANHLIRAVLIERGAGSRRENPIRPMTGAIESGDSLIVFPEGTRNMTDEPLLPFKSGIYHLARSCPQVDFVPVWIENSRRVMPKGRFVPIPLLCTLSVGAPLRIEPNEDKAVFLERTRNALLALMPPLR
jgi:1-acyl-sn-glycerol-3-phosphate acyltransferase